MTRLEEIEARLAESDPGYYDWFPHDALRDLLEVAKAALENIPDSLNGQCPICLALGGHMPRCALAKLEATP